jgi:hypothetical protein
MALAGAIALSVASAAAAQGGGTSQDRWFRIQWQPYALGRATPSIEGWVYNDHRYRVGGVQLRIQGLDAAGQPVGETTGWVYGNIPSGGRTYFVIPVPRGATTYQITVSRFHLVALEGAESP